MFSKMVDMCETALWRLYDQDEGGFFFGYKGDDTIDRRKLLRYNARVLLLLDGGKNAQIQDTFRFIFDKLLSSDARPPFHSIGNNGYATLGDIALFVSALKKHGLPHGHFLKLVEQAPKETMMSVPADQLPWVLEVSNRESIERDFIARRFAARKYGVPFLSFPTLIYSLHYFTVSNKIELADWVYELLTKYLYQKNGGWALAHLHPFTYRKLFSVHQLGMAPLYLLEYYEKSQNPTILQQVKKSIECGLQFVGPTRIYRSLSMQETRSYECAFDMAGLKKAGEYL